ncbi:MAG: M81 family metallopeptidase [Alphaproteobacteria bacterium]
MPTIAIARFSHEGNSFSPVPTTRADFERAEWAIADEAIDRFRDTATEIGGAIDFLARHPDWRPAWLRLAGAPPSGPLTADCYRAILDEIVAGLGARRWDAVYLSLHGAMVADGTTVADLETIRAVRAAIGTSTPLGVSFDLHANLAPESAGLMTVAAGYKTHPHVDQRETAVRVLDMLAATLSGRARPSVAIAKLDAILPSINMRTLDGPMAEIEAAARRLEQAPDVLDVSPFGGFSYGDCPAAGASVMATVDGPPARAAAVAAAGLAEMRTRRDRFYIDLPDAAEGIRRALAAARGPVAVVDAGDNPASGGIGDTPALFRALLAAADRPAAVFAFFCDPPLVERARASGVGGTIEGTLGGRITPAFGPPVPFRGQVLRLTDGRFRNSGPMMHNLAIDVGPTALIETAGVRVIVTTGCQSPNDPALFRLHGIEPAAERLLCVKAKNHFRAAFRDICAEMIDIDAPGPAALDIASFPFRHAPAHLHPLAGRRAAE